MNQYVARVIVPNPDFMFEPPIYEGDSDSAHGRVVAGTYECYEELSEREGRLVVTETSSVFIPAS